MLLRADLGMDTAGRVVEALSRQRLNKEVTPEEVRAVLAAEVEKVLGPVAQAARDRRGQEAVRHPRRRRQRHRQDHDDRQARRPLPRRGEERDALPPATPSAPPRSSSSRSGASARALPSSPRAPGSDSASLAFEALAEAKASGADVLLIDTAGRLQNKAELMAELAKVLRVLKKQDATAPHAVLLTLDATTGPERVESGRGFPRAGRRDRARDDQARRHRARRHSGRHRRQDMGCRCISSASAKRSTTFSLSPRSDFARAIAGLA